MAWTSWSQCPSHRSAHQISAFSVKPFRTVKISREQRIIFAVRRCVFSRKSIMLTPFYSLISHGLKFRAQKGAVRRPPLFSAYSTLGLCRPLFLLTGTSGIFPLFLPNLPSPLLFLQFLRRRLRERHIEFSDKLQVNINFLHPFTIGPVRRVDNDLVKKIKNHRRGQHR